MPTRLRASGPVGEAFGGGRQRLWIGFGPADFEGDRVGVVAEADAALVRGVRLAHLLGAVAQAHDAGGLAEDQRLDRGEEVGAVVVVELLGDVVGEFDVLALVVADGDARRLIGEDVGGHQARVGVEPGGCVLAILAGLVLELGHPVQPADAGDAGEDPAEADMGGDGGLQEQDVAGGVDAAGDERGGHLAGRGGERGRVLEHGDRVLVHDAVDALVVALQATQLRIAPR